MKNAFALLAKKFLFSTTRINSSSLQHAAIQKKSFGSGTTSLVIWEAETNDTVKIVKSLEESGLLMKGGSETIKDEAKEQECRFLSMSLGKLGASLL